VEVDSMPPRLLVASRKTQGDCDESMSQDRTSRVARVGGDSMASQSQGSMPNREPLSEGERVQELEVVGERQVT
jgi:hypothetical protein